MKKNTKKNLLIVTGTRAEYQLFRSTIFKLRRSQRLRVKLLVTGMHTLPQYGSTINEIKKDFPIDSVVPIKTSDDMTTALAQEIIGINRYLKTHPVDAVLVIADRDEPFAAATAAIHHNIPLIHISGGDVSGPSVDHKLRNAITVFSRLHLVQTKKSRANVIRLGAQPKSVHIVGSAGLDGLQTSRLLSKKGLASRLKLNAAWPWYVVVIHPTPFEKTPLKKQIDSVVTAVKQLPHNSEKIIFYPNTDTGSKIFIKAILALKKNPTCHLIKNISHETYLALLYRSEALIGNTSSGLMEAGFLKIPFILVGNRQKNRERGPNVIPVSYSPQQIIKAAAKAQSKSFIEKVKKLPSAYQGGDVSGRILKAIEHAIDSI